MAAFASTSATELIRPECASGTSAGLSFGAPDKVSLPARTENDDAGRLRAPDASLLWQNRRDDGTERLTAITSSGRFGARSRHQTELAASRQVEAPSQEDIVPLLVCPLPLDSPLDGEPYRGRPLRRLLLAAFTSEPRESRRDQTRLFRLGEAKSR